MSEDKILNVEYSDEMKQSYLNYSLSVIIARALPDIRDGLKPVQRRIIYEMGELGLKHSSPYKKSARIVGSVMGRWHPHGDGSIYGALVNMSQDFKENAPLVDGHGNMGSYEGDGAAAMRYTEARLLKFSEDVFLSDLNKDVIDFVKNYDSTEMEPSVLPCKIPHLLLNGAEGIAVGMAASIAPHNLSEIIDAEIALLKDSSLSVEDLMCYVLGPDFPTGGIVTNKKDLLEIYETGCGKIKIRGKVEVEELKGGKKRLAITEIPFTMVGVGMSKFLCDVIDLAENKTLPEVVDVSNQTNKDGIKLVIELRKDADVERVKNILYKKTKLEDTFGVNMLAILDGRPGVFGLKSILQHHIDFKYECETRKYKALLEKSLLKKEVQEGLIKACDIIDLIIEVLRGSKNIKDAKLCLTTGSIDNVKFKRKASENAAKSLNFTDLQAQAILDMKLQKLIGLELDDLKTEYKNTLKTIGNYEKILSDKKIMVRLMVSELEDIKKKYGSERKTKIEDVKDIVIEAPIVREEPLMMLMDRFGYSRTIDIATYEKNKDAIQAESKYIIPCVNIGKIYIFTNSGQLHQVKVSDLPCGKLRDKGVPIDNISNYKSATENIVYMCDERELESNNLLFTTKNGMMKQVEGSEFIVSKRTTSATSLQDNDELISISVINKKDNVVLVTKNSYFLKFAASEVPLKKKGAIGVRGIKLSNDDSIECVYLYKDGVETKIDFNGKSLTLNKLKLAKRDGVGIKQK